MISQRQFSRQHNVAVLEQCGNYSKQCSNNVATLCCAKNPRCESSSITSSLESKALYSQTRMTTSTRFSQYWVLITREPTSFWRENAVAVVIVLRVLVRIGSLSRDVFERSTSTGSELFSLLVCLDANKFVLLSFFSPLKTIYSRVSTKPLPNDAKSSLPVDVRRSKTLLLKLPIVLVAETSYQMLSSCYRERA